MFSDTRPAPLDIHSVCALKFPTMFVVVCLDGYITTQSQLQVLVFKLGLCIFGVRVSVVLAHWWGLELGLGLELGQSWIRVGSGLGQG